MNVGVVTEFSESTPIKVAQAIVEATLKPDARDRSREDLSFTRVVRAPDSASITRGVGSTRLESNLKFTGKARRWRKPSTRVSCMSVALG